MSEEKWECGCSKEPCKKELAKCEDWEIKRKKHWEEILASDKAPNCPGHSVDPFIQKSDWVYSTGGRGTTYLACPNGCGKMYKKVTEYGDELELEHECKQSSNTERERERERDQIKQYLQQNNIHSITLQPNGELLIEYNNQESKTMSANNQQLQQIKTYLQSQGKPSINQNELKTEQSTKKNHLPWIWGGVGVIGLVGLVVYFLRRKKGSKENG